MLKVMKEYVCSFLKDQKNYSFFSLISIGNAFFHVVFTSEISIYLQTAIIFKKM